jgi:hypothetical protein
LINGVRKTGDSFALDVALDRKRYKKVRKLFNTLKTGASATTLKTDGLKARSTPGATKPLKRSAAHERTNVLWMDKVLDFRGNRAFIAIRPAHMKDSSSQHCFQYKLSEDALHVLVGSKPYITDEYTWAPMFAVAEAKKITALADLILLSGQELHEEKGLHEKFMKQYNKNYLLNQAELETWDVYFTYTKRNKLPPASELHDHLCGINDIVAGLATDSDQISSFLLKQNFSASDLTQLPAAAQLFIARVQPAGQHIAATASAQGLLVHMPGNNAKQAKNSTAIQPIDLPKTYAIPEPRHMMVYAFPLQS